LEIAHADDSLNNCSNYPLTIFGSVLGFLLTFGVPLSFTAYFPAEGKDHIS
jgi:ABC-type uncharacterized transport system permease subunit